jgi:hypothetical protein
VIVTDREYQGCGSARRLSHGADRSSSQWDLSHLFIRAEEKHQLHNQDAIPNGVYREGRRRATPELIIQA